MRALCFDTDRTEAVSFVSGQGHVESGFTLINVATSPAACALIKEQTAPKTFPNERLLYSLLKSFLKFPKRNLSRTAKELQHIHPFRGGFCLIETTLRCVNGIDVMTTPRVTV